ncbi:DUF373 family protein, partial [Candidatus Bathyarchaeota archaeon]|nr:DUF373 family protein [Candidatus Bathyarchaeota archaeon]
MEATAKAERTLVLCVDRDDDLGVKAGIETPILGRVENINAAVKLALRDPEEPDANAIFEAVRIFDRLTETVEKEGGQCQIATLAGSELGGVGADRKLVSEFNEVLKTFPATDIVLVVDGFTDETILPLIQSRVPVTSVRRITVRHSQSIEETVWLFSRYLKMLIENPRYARIALGLPGILLIVIGILSVFNLLVYTWIAFLIVLGTFLAIKGFGIDKAVRSFYIWVKEYTPPPFPVQISSFSAVAGVLLVGIGLYQGLSHTSAKVSSLPDPPLILGEWISLLPFLVGEFISNSIILAVIGICVLLSGRAIRWFFERDNRLWRTIVIVVVVAWSSQVFYEASRILVDPTLGYGKLVFTIVVSIIWSVLAVLVTSLLHRKYADLFEGEEETGEKEEKAEES